MDYIPRSMEPLIKQVMAEYPAVLVTGARQVGKTTVVEHVLGSHAAQIERLSLDDLALRQLAQNDPVMFFELHQPPVLIDEVQHAPGLFPEMKRLIDAGAPAGSFLLTGSQQFRLMELAGESLAGRIAVIPMSSLTLGEEDLHAQPPVSLGTEQLKARASAMQPRDAIGMFDIIRRGSMPAVVSGKRTNLEVFYSSYLQTYIERDVRRLLGDVDALQFLDFVRAAAARCAQVLNVSAIAQDVGIRSEKAKAWLAILERSGIIFYLHPYSNNQLTRTVKAPKLYFYDCGLVANLTRWSNAEAMEAGAMSGAFIENFAISEMQKMIQNAAMGASLYYYRDRDGREIDAIIEMDGKLHPIEVKKTASPNRSMVRAFSALDKALVPRGKGVLVCLASDLSALDTDTLVVPLWMV